MFPRFLLLFLLVPTPSLWSQCSSADTAACRDECGPIQDVGKQRYAQCVRACLAQCSKHHPPTCKNATGALFPKYYILDLIYAPPGCTNTATLKCAAESSVDYQAGSAMGTKVSTDSSFASNINLTVDTSFGVGDIIKLGASASGGYANTSTDSKSETITKGETLDIKANGNGDGVDHSQDAFILLLNPAVAVQETQQVVDNKCGPTVVNWYFGLSGTSGTQDRYTLYVQWLKNPSSMPANVAQQLQTLGFTNDDFQTILAQDPFANGSTTIDPNRFAPTTYSFPYEPPLQESACNNGVCSCISMSDSIKNQFQTDAESKSQDQYSLGFTEKISGIDVGIFSFGASSDQKFTWTSSSTTANTTDSSQTATATIVCPSTGYQGPTLMSIYWDKLFGSFLFVPTTLTPATINVLSKGTALTAAGEPIPHVPVTLRVGTKTYRTWSDNHGDYVFFRPAGLKNVSPKTTGLLSIRGVQRTVTLGRQQKLRIRIP
jgi:hypothetical protein